MKNITLFLIFVLFWSLGLNIHLFNKSEKNNAVNETLHDSILTDEGISWTYQNVSSGNVESINMETFLSNDDLIVSDVFNQLDWNLFMLMTDEFEKIKNKEDFTNFYTKYNWVYYLLWISKLKNKILWDTYFDWIFKMNSLNNREDFNKKLDDFFLDIQNGNSIEPTEKDGDFDIKFFTNTLPLTEGLEACNILKEADKYFTDIVSCKDKIYFYRANDENKYCDKIIDQFKKRICNDFLEYQKNNK